MDRSQDFGKLNRSVGCVELDTSTPRLAMGWFLYLPFLPVPDWHPFPDPFFPEPLTKKTNKTPPNIYPASFARPADTGRSFSRWDPPVSPTAGQGGLRDLSGILKTCSLGGGRAGCGRLTDSGRTKAAATDGIKPCCMHRLKKQNKTQVALGLQQFIY